MRSTASREPCALQQPPRITEIMMPHAITRCLDDAVACIAAMEACMTSRAPSGLKVFKGAELILEDLDHGGQDVHGFRLCRFGLNALGKILHHERTALEPLRTMMIVLVEQVSSPVAQNSCRRHLQQKKY